MSNVSNICNYSPIETLSRKALDNKFNVIHRYLCYLSGVAANAGSVVPGQISIGGQAAMRYGTTGFIGNGVTDNITIPHGLGVNPTLFFVFNDSPITTNFQGRTITADAVNVYVDFNNPPGIGENATYVWLVAV